MKNKIANELKRRVIELTKLMPDSMLDRFLDDIGKVILDLADIEAMQGILAKMQKAVKGE